MIVAVARDLWKLGRVPARRILTRGRPTLILSTFKFGGNELERRFIYKRQIDWYTYKGGNLRALEVEVQGFKHKNESEQGDFSKIDGNHFFHVLSFQEAEAEFFSLDDISESESVIMGGSNERLLIPNRMVNMLGFINERLDKNSPVISEKSSTI